MLINEEDIGAETLKRYEYQKLWNILLVLDLALHRDKKAIYSEFLDDITIEYFNLNQYEVIQVKTKDTRRFSINDKEIRKTLDIFLSIEERFKNKIGKYYILTNGIFFHYNKGYDIYKLISAFNSGSEQKKDSAYEFLKEEIKEKGKLISRIKTINDYDKEIVISMFKKLKIEPQKKYSYEVLSQKIDEVIGKILKTKEKIPGQIHEIPGIRAEIKNLVNDKSCNDAYDKNNPIYGFGINQEHLREEDLKDAKRITLGDISRIFKKVTDKYNKRLRKITLSRPLEPEEKEILISLQEFFRVEIFEKDYIYQSTPNGFKISEGRISHLKLTNLTSTIESIPLDLFKLKELKFLSLSTNKIRKIPNEINQLSKLEELYLGSNNIVDIPPNLFELENLKIISLSSNRISSLNGKIFEMASLEKLLINDNPIKAINNFPEIIQLKKLDISNNLLDSEIKLLVSKTIDRDIKLLIDEKDDFRYHKFSPIKKRGELSFQNIEVDKLKKNNLVPIKTPIQLAYLLKIHIKTLRKILVTLKKNPNSLYKTAFLRKKNGKLRFLHIPNHWILKKIQNLIRKEILIKVDMGNYAFGYVKNRSAKLNAQFHLNSKLLFNIDLKNFFYNIKFIHVYEAFKDIGYSSGIASILTCLTTYTHNNNSFLPQGTQSSPAISNLIFRKIDLHIAKIARYHHFRYSRYGDDLSFSSLEAKYASKEMVSQIFQILRRYGFWVNTDKIKFARSHQKQVVTGILVNGKECSLPRKHVKRIRAGLHQMEMEEISIDQKLHIFGMCRNARHINYKKYNCLMNRFLENEPFFEEDYNEGNLFEDDSFNNENNLF